MNRRRPTPTLPARSHRPRIVIVGANFAGLSAALRLGGDCAATVIDSSPWFEWLPNIHELLSGVKRPGDLRLPRSRLVARAGHRFVRATVNAVDPAAGRVLTADGRCFDFDACIVAVGGLNDTFGVRGADRHAMPFDGVAGCDAIGRALATLARSPGSSSVVIVGGGLEGIEALGEILRRYRRHESMSLTVVEAGPRLLPGMPPSLDAAVRKRCVGHNVRFVTRSPVTSVTRRRVRLKSGEVLRSDLTIWTGGMKPPPLLFASDLADRPGRWAPVARTLRSTRHDNVFVIGDAAALPRPLAKQAFYAMQMGTHAADNAVRAVTGRRVRDFRPSQKPMLVAFGDLDTYLVSGRSVISSTALAAVKEAVFQVTMAQFDPPLGSASLRKLGTRLGGVAAKLALPTLASGELRAALESTRRR
jgi:NADH dehydrogenase FAD-containing subunit